ncbi:hypothetical protein F441_19536 [Phytophthora nicotianae CJ01A1]|uniref:Uncharacterized protein n=1 Tax=Phytophthora nicotianae CJ01A1 TaxID=1317063 RepID=W2VZA7_PHYNI|nr:hypothetical protein F441_19536 [Phytophthora nicotianae CJ01A1]
MPKLSERQQFLREITRLLTVFALEEEDEDDAEAVTTLNASIFFTFGLPLILVLSLEPWLAAKLSATSIQVTMIP